MMIECLKTNIISFFLGAVISELNAVDINNNVAFTPDYRL